MVGDQLNVYEFHPEYSIPDQDGLIFFLKLKLRVRV